jgi:hypothetical protein
VRKFLETEQGKEACLVLVLGCPPTGDSQAGTPYYTTFIQFERVIFVVFSAEDETAYL